MKHTRTLLAVSGLIFSIVSSSSIAIAEEEVQSITPITCISGTEDDISQFTEEEIELMALITMAEAEGGERIWKAFSHRHHYQSSEFGVFSRYGK